MYAFEGQSLHYLVGSRLFALLVKNYIEVDHSIDNIDKY